MKIKITEAQLSMIKKLREEANDFESTFQTYNNFCLEKAKELDTIYTKLINESIGNVLNKTINIEQLSQMVGNIETQLYDANRKIYRMLELKYPDNEDPFSEYDNEIWKINGYTEKKSDSLNIILDAVKKLQDEDDEDKIKEPFKNIKPIEVQSFGPGDFEP